MDDTNTFTPSLKTSVDTPLQNANSFHSIPSKILLTVPEEEHDIEGTTRTVTKRSSNASDELAPLNPSSAKRPSTASSFTKTFLERTSSFKLKDAKRRRSSFSVQPPPVSRKRSSTTSAATNRSTHILNNISIFKRDSSIIPDHVTIENFGDVENEDQFDTPPLKHVKAYTVNTALDAPIVKTVSLNRIRSARTRKLTVGFAETPKPESSSMHKRQHSVITFITSPDTKELQVKKTIPNLDSLHIPRRWLSLRNVISFVNAIILMVAVTVVAMVSYYIAVSSTRQAVAAMSNVTMSSITLKLDDVLNNAFIITTFLESSFTAPSANMSDTLTSLQTLYFITKSAQADVDQVYVARSDISFNGVATLRFANGKLDPARFNVNFLNDTTKPQRISQRVSTTCSRTDIRCVRWALRTSLAPLANETYNSTTRPFYQAAISSGAPTWTPIYQYANEKKTLGITTARPVYKKNTIDFVAAVDITLATFSDYLYDMTVSLAGQSATLPFLYILEPSTGLLVATSDPSYPPFDQSSGNRLSPFSYSAEKLVEPASFLLDSYSSLTSISWPADGSPIVSTTSSVQMIFFKYEPSPSLSWIIIAYVPFSLYLDKLSLTYAWVVPVVSIIVILVSTVISVLLTRAIGKPLKNVAREMMEVADLDFGNDANQNDHEMNDSTTHEKKMGRWELKEVQYLKSAMTAMKSGLKSFSKYVPTDIVSLLVKLKKEAVLGVDEAEITVFFSDVVNFTSIVEKMNPSEMVQWMSEYLSEMSDIIVQNQGTLDKYIGDAIMAFWNAPISVNDHASVACSVALKCHQRLALLRQRWLTRGLPEIHVRIGVNTGRAFVGNLGSPDRMNYTCLGDSVNLGSRLEGLNKRYGTSILISEHTERQLRPNTFVTRPLDVVMVKGKTQPVKVFELMNFRKYVSDETMQKLAIYQNSFDHFVAGNLIAAKEGFERYLNLIGGHDFVTERHLQRIAAHHQEVTWSPIVILDDK